MPHGIFQKKKKSLIFHKDTVVITKQLVFTIGLVTCTALCLHNDLSPEEEYILANYCPCNKKLADRYYFQTHILESQLERSVLKLSNTWSKKEKRHKRKCFLKNFLSDVIPPCSPTFYRTYFLSGSHLMIWFGFLCLLLIFYLRVRKMTCALSSVLK